MAIDTGKILTIEATDWLNLEGKSPCDYRAVGVHYYDHDTCSDPQLVRKFAKEVPPEAEVVVKYVFTLSNFGNESTNRAQCIGYASGTALIPRHKK